VSSIYDDFIDASALFRWHGLWLAVVVAGAAGATLAAGALPGATYLGFLALLGAGVLGLGLGHHPRVALLIWAAAAAVAVGTTGGLSGPGAPWGLLPFAVAAAGGRKVREAAALAVAAALTVFAAEAAAVSPAPMEDLGGRAAVALAALATTAWAVITGFRLNAPAPASAMAGGPDPARMERERAQALALELAEARRALEAAAGARAEAEAARTAADAANQAKSRFLANMSHELRTPLNAVMGFADIMRNRLFGPLPDRYAEYAQLIHESGAHLLELINDVLDMSKIEADRYRLQREAFDAREAVSGVLRLMRTQAEEAGVDVRGELPEGALAVEADKRAVKQIVLNLLSNALKFTPRGGSVTLSVLTGEDDLILVVADTGVGVAPEDLERLGRPYEQAGDAEVRAQGTGLGLSLVRAFAELHGGSMAIESELGEGTAVTVRLPVLTRAEAAPADGAQVIPFAAR